MPINAKPSPDWRLGEVRFNGTTIDGKPLTGWIEFIPDQHSFLDAVASVPVSVLGDQLGVVALAADAGITPTNNLLEYAELPSSVIAMEVVSTPVTLLAKNGSTYSGHVGVGSQLIPFSDPDMLPIAISYTVVEHFHEVRGRRYQIFPKYADAGTGIDLPTLAPYDLSAAPPPPPTAPPKTYTFEAAKDGDLLTVGKEDVTAFAGTPIYATTAAIHDKLGWNGGSTTRLVPYSPGFTLSTYLLVPGALTNGSSIFTLKNPFSVNPPCDVRLRAGGAIDLKAEDGSVPATSDFLWKAGQVMRADLQGAWDVNTGLLTVAVLLFIGNNFEGTIPDSTLSASYTASEPTSFSSGAPSGGVNFDTLRTWTRVVQPDPYGTAPPPPPPAALTPGVALWAGDATQTTVEVSGYTGDLATESVGLATSLAAAMSSPTLYTAGQHGAGGFNKWSVTGLTAGTVYYHQLTKDGAAYGPIQKFKTLRPVGTPCTIKVAAGSCKQSSPASTAAFLDMAAWAPDRVMNLGDMGYPNYLSTDRYTHERNFAGQLVDPAMQLIQAVGAVDYITSDHDVNGSGSSNAQNFNDPISATNLIAWGEAVPARLEDTRFPKRARYRAEVEGRVRFVKLDTRSQDKSDNTATSHDVTDSTLTMLGATQLAWVQGQINAAQTAHQLVVLWTDPAWNGKKADVIPLPPPIPTSYADKWPSYQYERDLISDYAAARAVTLFIVHGDSHGLQQDDGTNEKNGFAVVCAGPWHQNCHAHYQASYQWTYPAGMTEGGTGGVTRNAMMWQRLTFADNGTTITVTAEARECTPKIVGSTPTTVRTMTKVITP